ncbi:MAG: FABP family protein [Propionibacteriaceae bacterium]|nr:FABP family protein [Propionibacteriaceae bacterium]
MAFEIPSDLDPALTPIAWLIGRWEGGGNGEWPGGGSFTYAATLDVTQVGQPWLHSFMQLFEIDDAGAPVRPLQVEAAFWRPQPDGRIEVVSAQPEGVAEVYVGRVDGAKIELRTDVVARTETAAVAATGGHRLLGTVDSELYFAWDRGTADAELQPYLWMRLGRRA